MAILNNPAIRQRSGELARQNREGNRLLVLVYCGVLAVLSLGSSGLNLLLDSQIGQTGGLDGMGLRAILETAEEILFYINVLFGPFWSAGFLYAMLTMARGGAPRLEHLTEGFRRLGRILGHLAFDFLLVIALATASMYLAGILYTFTPWGTEFTAIMTPVLEHPDLIAADGTLNMALLPMEELAVVLRPMLVMGILIFLPVYLYLSLCFRMSMYLVMDRPISGVQAHFESMRLMRGHKWQLLKLDLSYWWYYALALAAGVLGYLDQILPLVGVELPKNSQVPFFLALGLYFLAYIAISLWKKCEVDGAYVLAYEAIAYPEESVLSAEV